MARENMLFENDDKSYTTVDLYLNNRVIGYKDSYNYYDNEINAFKKNNKVMFIYNDGK